MSSLRDEFVQKFGEADATRIERAAAEHKNGIHDKPGSDPFRWALAICVGYECCTSERYAKYHGIENGPAIDAWMRENAVLHEHDGDVDYLAVFAGAYQPYVRKEAEKADG